MTLHLRIAIAAAAVVVASGCASPKITMIEAAMLVPPDVIETAPYKRVAVLPFEGPQGETIAARVASALSGMRLDNRPVFTVVDYRELQGKEQELYEMAINPPLIKERLQEVGRALGVQGIYTGTVSAAGAGETYSRERVTSCAQDDYQRRNQCVQVSKTGARCSGVESYISFEVRLLDVAGGWTVYAGTASGQPGSEDCDYHNVTDRPEKRELIYDLADFMYWGSLLIVDLTDDDEKTAKIKTARNEALESAIAQLLNAVGPHVVSVDILLKDPGAEIVSRDARTRMLQGLEAAEKNDIGTACRLWAEARALQQESATILYNLAVCEELQEHLPEAHGLYLRSAALPGGQDACVGMALQRLKDRIAIRETLERIY